MLIGLEAPSLGFAFTKKNMPSIISIIDTLFFNSILKNANFSAASTLSSHPYPVKNGDIKINIFQHVVLPLPEKDGSVSC